MGKHRPAPDGEPLAALLVRLNPPTPPTIADDDTDVFDAVRPPLRSHLVPWAAGAAVAGVVITGAVVAPHATFDPPTAAPVSRESDLSAGRAAAPALAAERLASLAASRATRQANEAAAAQVQAANEQAAQEKAAQEAQEAAAEALRQEEATKAAEAAQQATVTADDPTESASPAAAPGSAAEVAVQTAMAQIGKPYVWGAVGPGTFDCSGLMLYAYAAAGIDLPRVSRDQAKAGVAVSRDELQPGDLVAYYSPVTHIGMYIGNGQIVHAPEPGDVVKVTSINAFGSAPTALRRVA